jgi:type IV fimbrial biogenesis protein FimT
MIRRKDLGFTLIELIITMVVFAVLATMAIPAYQDLIKRNRMKTEINALIRDLHFTRSAAVKHNKTIAICAANAALSNCSATASNWLSSGWLVTEIDAGNNLVGQPLRIQQPFPSQDTLKDNVNTTPIRFNRFGVAENNIRTFKLCDKANDSQYSRQLLISRSGQLTLAAMGASTCP